MALVRLMVAAAVCNSVVSASFADPVFTEPPQDMTTVEGSSLIWRCFASNTHMNIWEKNDVTLEGLRYRLLDHYHLVIEKVSISDSGKYKCHAFNFETYLSKEASLIVKERTRITVEPEYYEVLVGAKVTFRCHVQCDKTLTPSIEWHKNGKKIDFDSELRLRLSEDNSLTIMNATELGSDNYTCVASTELDKAEAQATLIVQVHTRITLKPHEYEVLVGAAVTFSCNVQSSKTLTPSIEWLNNGEKIDFTKKLHYVRSEDNSLIIINTTRLDSGNYTCVVSTRLDKAEAQATLTVRDDTRITLKPQYYEVLAGDTATFFCNVQTHMPFTESIEWLKNGKKIEFAKKPRFVQSTDNSLTILNTTELDSGNYTCVVSTRLDKAEAQATLTVKEHTRITHMPRDYEVLSGAAVTFSCNAVSDKTLTPSVEWLSNGEKIDVRDNHRLIHSIDNSLTIMKTTEMDSGNYTCVVSTRLDTAEAQATLTVQEHIRITLGPRDYEVLIGAAVTFSCNVQSSKTLTPSIEWLKNGEKINFTNETRFIISTGNSLIITNTMELDSGNYTCVVYTGLDKAEAQATLTVQAPKTKKTMLVIGIIIIISSCLVLLLIFICIQKKRKSKKTQKDRSNIPLIESNTTQIPKGSSSNVLYSPSAIFGDTLVEDTRWEFPRENLEIGQCLGEGEFGLVLKACAANINGIKGTTVVAVKTLKNKATDTEIKDLLCEYKLMKHVVHPNIVKLLGICSSPGPLYVIIEFAEHGCLRTFLRRRPPVSLASVGPTGPQLPYQTLLDFACQICCGMSYLTDNKIVHRDLAARNVLVATGHICKVSDFGLSRDLYLDEIYQMRSNGKVPVKWMAPESLGESVYTSKSDVWSFGVLLWELVTLGSTPYPGITGREVLPLLKEGYRMSQPERCTDQLYKLMCDCWIDGPDERPTFLHIYNRLVRLMEQDADQSQSAYIADPRWEFPRENLEIGQCLGEGEFGKVLKARATNINGIEGPTVVAVKTVKDEAPDCELKDLMSEYEIMKDVCHPNIVRLLGACTSPGPLYVIIEFAEYGCLRSYLRRSRSESLETEGSVVPPLSNQTLLDFACQVCSGMSYLAVKKIVHRDLAARNVLLAAGQICKVSDFGLSRDVYLNEIYLKRSVGKVQVKWMALESLLDRVFTSKSDVWSYGVLLWELVTLGSEPYPGVTGREVFSLLQEGYRMSQPQICTDQLYKLMCDCWLEDPKSRPSFTEISERLERLLEEDTENLPPQREHILVTNRGYISDFSPNNNGL